MKNVVSNLCRKFQKDQTYRSDCPVTHTGIIFILGFVYRFCDVIRIIIQKLYGHDTMLQNIFHCIMYIGTYIYILNWIKNINFYP